jgi:CheY-like chemotaxis protein
MIKQWANNPLTIDQVIPPVEYQIVYVDSNSTNLNLWKNSCKPDWVIYTIENSLEALIEIIKYQPDLIFLAWSMPDLDGYELAQLIRKNPSLTHIPIIFVGQKINMISQIKAKLLGVQDYLTEPFSTADIQSIIQKYLT